MKAGRSVARGLIGVGVDQEARHRRWRRFDDPQPVIEVGLGDHVDELCDRDVVLLAARGQRTAQVDRGHAHAQHRRGDPLGRTGCVGRFRVGRWVRFRVHVASVDAAACFIHGGQLRVYFRKGSTYRGLSGRRPGRGL
ncbi:MAG: hypothetical protein MZV64_10175 [Ignavibacteriales bacterium]|nr:hypothetical protein [Ignavibacteriales bacterium]